MSQSSGLSIALQSLWPRELFVAFPPYKWEVEEGAIFHPGRQAVQ